MEHIQTLYYKGIGTNTMGTKLQTENVWKMESDQ